MTPPVAAFVRQKWLVHDSGFIGWARAVAVEVNPGEWAVEVTEYTVMSGKQATRVSDGRTMAEDAKWN